MKWRKEEVEYLRENYSKSNSIGELVIHLGKSKRAILHKAARLGLSRSMVPHNKPIDKNHRNVIDKRYYETHKKKIYERKIKRLRYLKAVIVERMGGKCSGCGYNKCLGALDFHHTSLNKEKDVTFILKNLSREKALKEANKCILLCANCHRQLHYKGL